MGISVPPITIIAHRHIGDEVIAPQPSPIQVGVIRDTRINDGNPHPTGAGGDVPGGGQVDAVGFKVMPLVGVLRIIGRQGREHAAIWFGIGHIGQESQALADGFYLGYRQGCG